MCDRGSQDVLGLIMVKGQQVFHMAGEIVLAQWKWWFLLSYRLPVAYKSCEWTPMDQLPGDIMYSVASVYSLNDTHYLHRVKDTLPRPSVMWPAEAALLHYAII